MSDSMAIQLTGVRVRPLLAVLALAITFLLGVGGGYLARTVSTPAAAAPQVMSVPSETPEQTILPNRT